LAFWACHWRVVEAPALIALWAAVSEIVGCGAGGGAGAAVAEGAGAGVDLRHDIETRQIAISSPMKADLLIRERSVGVDGRFQA
jgi:hypothetical protein